MTLAIKINANDGVKRNIMSGGETEVDFDFPIFEDTHIQIYETDAAGAILLLVKDTDYTVPSGSVAQQAGGTVTLDTGVYPTGATATHVFTAYQAAPEARVTDFNQAGDYFANTLNKELDLLAQQLQQMRRDLNRAPLAPVDTAIANFSLPAPIDGQVIGWSGTTGLMANISLASIAALDTVFTSLTLNDFMQWNGTNWVNKTPAQVGTSVGVDAKAAIAGQTFTGQVNFSGTTHAGIKLISLTTTQRNALTPLVGMTIWNTTTTQAEIYNGASWGNVISPDASLTVKGIVERATDAEVATGADTTRYVTPKQLADKDGGKVLGQAYIETTALISGTTAIPVDDTIPQNTEGLAVLERSYTPISATSKIVVMVGAPVSCGSNQQLVGALFVDSTANALAAQETRAEAGGSMIMAMTHEETSASTTLRTYKYRIGGTGTTININGVAGTRRFGGVSKTFIKIIEIEV